MDAETKHILAAAEATVKIFEEILAAMKRREFVTLVFKDGRTTTFGVEEGQILRVHGAVN